MKKLLILSLLVLCVFSLRAQQSGQQKFSVAFYNLENLFDTIHDSGKDDYEFLPNGDYHWTGKRYEAKLKNMARVLGDLSRDKVSNGPAVIGVAEVENDRVLVDLTSQKPISNYKFVHYEGPDKRGIDCALLYDPKQFSVKKTKLVLSMPYQGDTVHLTRGFLIVDGLLGGEHICFVVNHWPSRGAESPVRVHAAEQVKALKDSLLREDKNLKLIVMGDLNDDPMDMSLKALGTYKFPDQVKKGDFYNPWWQTLEDKGVGTLLYKGKWNLFDQILISKSLLEAKKGLVYESNEVFNREYLIQQDGNYKGSPLRTFGGRSWLNGYSDHLPTIVYLEKK